MEAAQVLEAIREVRETASAVRAAAQTEGDRIRRAAQAEATALRAGAEADAEALRREVQQEVGATRATAAAEAKETSRKAREEAKQEKEEARKAAKETQLARKEAEKVRQETHQAERRLAELRAQVVTTEERALLQQVGIYAYHHQLQDAVAYRSRLDSLQSEIKNLARTGQAVLAATDWTVNGSAREGRKMVRDFSKLMLRAYNAEADYAVRTMRPHRLNSLVDRLYKSRETIAKLGATMHIRISDAYHNARVRELQLTADFLQKKDEEKEAQREIRAREREEAAAQRELEREREKLQKELGHYQAVIERLRQRGDTVAADEVQGKLTEIEEALSSVESRAANIRAGYVYVISNVGAFGERMVKIGMTRRLEPLERIYELSGAAVPFRFDVHALIFSKDAVGLEAQLHKEFAARRVNRVNARKEFFRVTPAEVREALRRHAGNLLVEFREEPQALEWRASQAA
ncbi:chromosome segregation ATPase [Streptantibioticus cattleyicolor NRRL 8057 = DSM 46488]|uniref:Chromosome segregation ATPase n=2 Tax=Kitasatosporales TaxID=85011 RepID=F8JY83_STREN|nr:chromosome segregation ATPase [Streptantibioticus cattleyicolor NRRL 8057 = DSM 46488]MYS59302.1 DUF4041 domain-containing protein [Streptomyces sp. SID5468]CCB75023.1 putative ATPase [Streptantibioticus cattleyicolor NRRL 8057 = DSM 46488]